MKITEEEFEAIKYLTKTDLGLSFVADLVQRGYSTVYLISQAHSYEDYRKLSGLYRFDYAE